MVTFGASRTYIFKQHRGYGVLASLRKIVYYRVDCLEKITASVNRNQSIIGKAFIIDCLLRHAAIEIQMDRKTLTYVDSFYRPSSWLAFMLTSKPA